MKTKIIAVLAVAVVLLALPFWAKAETRKARLYNYVTEMHVMPIGFAQVPTNVIAERRGVAEYEDGEIATYLMRGAGKWSPKGSTLEGFSQYTFGDKSTNVVKWQAQITIDEGQLPKVTGQGTYVSGTGRFEGIQGEVSFSGNYVTPYDKEKGTLGDLIVDVISNFTLPSK